MLVILPSRPMKPYLLLALLFLVNFISTCTLQASTHPVNKIHLTSYEGIESFEKITVKERPVSSGELKKFNEIPGDTSEVKRSMEEKIRIYRAKQAKDSADKASLDEKEV